MRKLVITQNVTLDGSIEMLTDWFSPVADQNVDQSDLTAEMKRQDSECDAVLLGRQTFTDFRGYWPDADPETDPSGISSYLDGVQKYVVTTTLTDPAWQNSTIIAAEPLAQIDRLKQQSGKDIVVTGSITLTHALIEAGLVDEYRLFTYPAVQGRGRRLFPDGFELARLERIDAKQFKGNLTYAAYRPAV